MKNVVFWVGVKSNNQNIITRNRYGDFSWMDYSKLTWEYWCKKNNIEFIHYDIAHLDNHFKYEINWQRYFDVYSFIENKIGNDYDQILLTDASIMAKWNARNIFDYTDKLFCGLSGDENMSWVRQSINGYLDLFPNLKFNYDRHILSGFTIFNKSHKSFFEKFKKFYFDNYDIILEKQRVSVKKGRDQPILNCFLQNDNINYKILSREFGINHLYRFDLLRNDISNQNNLPVFVNNVDFWIFSGFPDRGESRNNIMKNVWNSIKEHYV